MTTWNVVPSRVTPSAWSRGDQKAASALRQCGPHRAASDIMSISALARWSASGVCAVGTDLTATSGSATWGAASTRPRWHHLRKIRRDVSTALGHTDACIQISLGATDT